MDEDKKFVFNGIEVVLTGRTAERKLSSRSKRVNDYVDVLHEIKPFNVEDGSFKKWVHLVELYEITKDN